LRRELAEYVRYCMETLLICLQIPLHTCKQTH